MRVEVFLFTGWFCLVSLLRCNHDSCVSYSSATGHEYYRFFCYLDSCSRVFDRSSLTVTLQDPCPRQPR